MTSSGSADLSGAHVAFRDVSARGTRMRVAIAGEGPPLLLVHDFLTSQLAWADVVGPLSRAFQVIVPDLPGFGESEKPAPERYAYGFEGFAESLLDLVAALSLGRVALCGHALGGSIAITLGADHPDVVEALLLVAPRVYGGAPAPLSLRIAGIPLLGPLAFKQLYGRAFFRHHFETTMYGGSARVPWDRVDKHFERFNVPAARQAAYATMLATRDLRPIVAKVPRITQPALVVWGRDDAPLPLAHSRKLAREIPGATLEILDCGHSPHEECPAAFALLVESFLTRARPA